MTKIMLVEDDNNLREIYEARLLAEGYEIISAKDGEEALAMAVKEKPDLIISDIMMPKISGFDMLDILRSTPETKDTKVIMMTALSQQEDKTRADKLGADRYLVKSQVTLEDVAKVTREVLSGEPASPAPATTPPIATDNVPVVDAPQDPVPVAATPVPTNDPATTDNPIISNTAVSSAPTTPDPTDEEDTKSTDDTTPKTIAVSSEEEAAQVANQVNDFVAQPVAVPTASDSNTTTGPSSENTTTATNDNETPEHSLLNTDPISSTVEPQTGPSSTEDAKEPPVDSLLSEPSKPEETTPSNEDNDNVPVAHKKVIEPINDVTPSAPNLNELLAKEQLKETISPVVSSANPPAETVVEPNGGATVTPAEIGTEPDQHKPGNIVHPVPESNNPSDIAL